MAFLSLNTVSPNSPFENQMTVHWLESLRSSRSRRRRFVAVAFAAVAITAVAVSIPQGAKAVTSDVCSVEGSGFTLTKSGSGASAFCTLTFNSSGNFTVPSGINSLNYLLVGGGGGGTGSRGGGGGAGGVGTVSGHSVSPSAAITVTVGAGGSAGANGQDTYFTGSKISGGGGAGGSFGLPGSDANTVAAGNWRGSGGGAGTNYFDGAYHSSSGGAGAFSGGSSGPSGQDIIRSSGGGGGAGSAGTTSNGGSGVTTAAIGGIGLGTYGGGGGGSDGRGDMASGSSECTFTTAGPGTGGSGIGGNGGKASIPSGSCANAGSVATAGAANTGSGGGGGPSAGAAGGSGLVVIAFALPTATVTANDLTFTFGDSNPQATSHVVKDSSNAQIASDSIATYTYTGISGTSYGPSTTRPTNAGTYSITPSDLKTSANVTYTGYSLSYANGTLTINKATPTFGSVATVNKTYLDGAFTLPTPTSSTPGTWQYASSNTSVVSLTGTTSAASTGSAGSSTITATFSPTSANYSSGGTVTFTVTVAKKAATLGSFAAISAVYGDSDKTPVPPSVTTGGTGTWAYSSNNASVATVVGTAPNLKFRIFGAGQATITATFTPDSANFDQVSTTALLTVSAKTLETPTSVTASVPQQAGALNISWSAVSLTTSFEVIFRKTGTYGDNGQLTTLSSPVVTTTSVVGSTSLNATGLSGDSVYRVSVKAIGDGQNTLSSPASTETATLTTYAAQPAPTLLETSGLDYDVVGGGITLYADFSGPTRGSFTLSVVWQKKLAGGAWQDVVTDNNPTIFVRDYYVGHSWYATSVFNSPILTAADDGAQYRYLATINGDPTYTGGYRGYVGAGTATSTPITTVVYDYASTIAQFADFSADYGDPDFAITTPAVTSAATAGTWSFSSDNPAVATIVNSKLHVVGVGTANITATFTPTDTNYSKVTDYATITVNKRTLSLGTFTPLVADFDTDSFIQIVPPSLPLDAPTGTWTYSSLDLNNIGMFGSMDPSSIEIWQPGLSNITATFTPDDLNNYEIVSSTTTAKVKVVLSLSGFTITNSTYGDSNIVLTAPSVDLNNAGVADTDGTFTYSSSANSVLTVENGNELKVVGQGSAVITATFTPGAPYADYVDPVSTTTTVTVSKKQITVSASLGANTQVFGAASPTKSFSTSGLVGTDTISSVSYTYADAGSYSSSLAPTAIGSYSVTPSAAVFSSGSASNYQITYSAANFTIVKANPTFNAFADLSITHASPFTTTITTPAVTPTGGAWSFSSSNSSVLTVSGSTITTVGLGTATITATYTPAAGDQGNYNNGSDTFDVVVSAPAVVQPTIVGHPGAVTTTAGQSAQFSVTASTTDAGTLSYQWFKGATALTNGATISGATSATLTLSALTAGDAGSYSVAVTNTLNGQTATRSSNAASLTVNPALAFRAWNASVGNRVGRSFSFDASVDTATGTGPYSYSIAVKSGTPSTLLSGLSGFAISSTGQITGQIGLDSLTSPNSNLFIVTATDATGATATKEVQMRVNATDAVNTGERTTDSLPTPVITVAKNAGVLKSLIVNWTSPGALLESMISSYSIKLYANGTTNTTSCSIANISKTLTTFTIMPSNCSATPLSDATTYFVTLASTSSAATKIASSGTSTRVSAATETAAPAPTITSSLPATSYAISSTAVSLSVSATSASGDLRYQWYKAGVLQSGATSSSLNVTSESSTSSKEYSVEITNWENGLPSAPVKITTILQSVSFTINQYGTPNPSWVVNTPITHNANAQVWGSGAGDSLTFALTGTLPAGLSFSQSTGLFSGTPTEAVTNRSMTVVTTSTKTGLTTSNTFNLNISKANQAALTMSLSSSTNVYGNSKIITVTVGGGSGTGDYSIGIANFTSTTCRINGGTTPVPAVLGANAVTVSSSTSGNTGDCTIKVNKAADATYFAATETSANYKFLFTADTPGSFSAAAAGAKAFNLSWTNNGSNKTSTVSYRIGIYNSSGTFIRSVAISSASTLTKTITATDFPEIADGTTYKFDISAIGSGQFGESFPSSLVSATSTIAAATPSISSSTAVSSTVINGNTASFSVTATTADTGTLTYQWQVATSSDNYASWANVSSGTGGTTNSYTSAALGGGVLGYKFRLKVTNTVAGPDTTATAFAYSSDFAVAIQGATQTITFANPGNKAFGSGNFTVSATTDAVGLNVAITSATTGVCTISGTTVTIVSAGTCTLNANQSGDSNYAAATQVAQTFTITQKSPVLSAPADMTKTYSTTSTTFTLNTPSATEPTGGNWTYTSGDTSVVTISGNTAVIRGAGTSVITATYTPAVVDRTNYNSSTSTSFNVVIEKAPQPGFTISTDTPSKYIKTWDGIAWSHEAAFSPSGVLGTGAITYSIAPAGFTPTAQNCAISGSGPTYTVTATTYGYCVITASIAESANYLAATSTRNFQFDRAKLASPTGASIVATPGSATSITLQATPNPNANYNSIRIYKSEADWAAINRVSALVNGAAQSNIYINNSNPIVISGLEANTKYYIQWVTGSNPLGDPYWTTSTTTFANATIVTTNAAVAAPTITSSSAGTLAKTVGNSLSLTASATGLGNGSGLAYQWKKNGVNIAGATSATYAVANVTVADAGAYTCAITDTDSGTGVVSPAATFTAATVTVAKADPVIGSLQDVTKTFGDSSFSPTNPSANPTGGTWTYSSATTSVATVSAGSIVVGNAGSSVITATYTPADTSNYNTVTTTFNLTVNKSSQTITFGSISNKTMTSPDLTPVTSSSSGLVVTLSSSTLSVCTVTNNLIHLVAVGTCTINANQSGNTNYLAASQVSQSFSISNQTQTITFNTLPNKTFGDANFALTATASSALTVSFSSATINTCTVSGSTVTLVAAGDCTINADQTGDSTYSAAPQVSRTFSIANAALSDPAAPTLTATAGVLKSITVSWSAIANSNGYLVKLYSLNGANPLATISVSGSTSTVIDTVDYASLADDTPYRVSIMAFGATNYANSNESAKSQVTTNKAYTITYKNTGSTGGTAPATGSYITGAAGTTIAGNTGSLVRTGYLFAGWNTLAAGNGTNYTANGSGSYATAENVDLHPVWTPQPITITFNSNFGTPTTTTQTFIADAAENLDLNTFSRPGYTFMGWATTAQGAVGYNNGQSYSTIVPITFYAKWEAIDYTIEYRTNGGTGTAPTETAKNVGDHFDVAAITGVSRTGYDFVGWSDGQSTYVPGNLQTKTYTVGTTNVILTAQWQIQTYTISYAINNATSGSPSRSTDAFVYGSNPIALPTVGTMTRTGYTFAGWSLIADGVALTGNYTASADVTLYARWTPNTYTVTYNSNGATGTLARTSDAYTTAGTAITLPGAGTLAIDGYTFGGWSETASGAAVSNSYTTVGDKTLYARWTAIDYQFDFVTAHGTTPTTVTKNIGQRITLPSVTAAGFCFAGWKIGSQTYDAGYSFLVGTQNETFTAVWIQIFDVHYNMNGSIETAPSDDPQLDGAVISALSAPTRDGYTFTGWKAQNNDVIAAGANFTVRNNRFVLSATWSAIDYPVTYSAVGGSPQPATVNKNYGDIFSVASAPSKSGHTFQGWSDGLNTYGPGASYRIGLSSVSLTAQWNAINYNVTYDINQGSSLTPVMSSKTIGQVFTVANAPVRFGYTFMGWSDGTSTFAAGDIYTVGAANVILTAQWSATALTMAYVLDGPVGSISPLTKFIGDTFSLASAPTWADHNFLGWSDGTTAFAPGATYTVTGTPVTFTAQWESILYGSTYLAGGATGNAPIGADLPVGTSFVLPTQGLLGKTGYTFAGWSSGLTIYQPGDSYIMTSSGVTFTATWNLIPVVNPPSNGGGSGGGSGGGVAPTPTPSPTPVIPKIVYGTSKSLAKAAQILGAPSLWKSESENCKVNAKGVVTPLSVGACEIKLIRKDSLKVASVYNFVIEPRLQISLKNISKLKTNRATLNAVVAWPGTNFKARFCITSSMNSTDCKFISSITIENEQSNNLTSKGSVAVSREIQGLTAGTTYFVHAAVMVGEKKYQTSVRKFTTPRSDVVDKPVKPQKPEPQPEAKPIVIGGHLYFKPAERIEQILKPVS